MRSEIHDKIDQREQLAAETAAVVEGVKARFAEFFEAAGGDISKTMAAMALAVEAELADLTTKAVRVGADGARKMQAAK